MGWCNGAAAAAAAGAALCPSKLHTAFLLHTTQPQLSSTCHHLSKAGGGAVLEIEAARKNQSGVRLQQSKRWKTDESGKKIGHAGIENFRNSLDTIQNKTDTSGGNAAAALLLLREDQALGQVMAAQANFMRVFIERAWEADAAAPDAVVAAERNGELASSELDCAQQNGQEENGNGVEARQGTELLCVVRALLKKIKRRVLVGDRVLVSGIDWIDRRGMVEDVLDRYSEIAEPPVANVEHLLVLFSLDRPKLDPLALSRFLVEAESTGIPFTLVLNKADMVQPEDIDRWKEKLAEWGYKPLICSVSTLSGIAPIMGLLKDKISVVVGPSGVGKSSLINALRDDAEDHEKFEALQVSEVSLRSGKGRHTTRHVSLLRLPGGDGLLADTPGFSQPSLAKVMSATLGELFPEVRAKQEASATGGCSFANCLHVGEPYCAVGSDWDRYSHYLGLLEEVRKREGVEKRVLGTKRESDIRYKMGAAGVKQAEPRLVPKRHRRESRKQVRQSLDEKLWEQTQEQAEVEDMSHEL
ncbi:unnamed protein product [Sphagnum troendelagicum]|uniref:Ribosome biogenesis GTPase RsgA n=1 Tax=Sphagnum troendelagicum TaxID=128251 RepID=A0ABP0U8F8_9BRYO